MPHVRPCGVGSWTLSSQTGVLQRYSPVLVIEQLYLASDDSRFREGNGQSGADNAHNIKHANMEILKFCVGGGTKEKIGSAHVLSFGSCHHRKKHQNKAKRQAKRAN